METILARLQQSFSVWQSTSLKKRHSNAGLRKEAVKCLEQHTHAEVSKAIGMSVGTLRLWQKSLRCHDQAVTDKAPAFVAMNIAPTRGTNEVSQALSLKIILPGDIVVQVESKSPWSSAAFIAALNRESNACSI